MTADFCIPQNHKYTCLKAFIQEKKTSLLDNSLSRKKFRFFRILQSCLSIFYAFVFRVKKLSNSKLFHINAIERYHL